MNPLTNMRNVTKLSEQELRFFNKTSWHDQYKDSAWIFIGGLPFDLTEGDIICIFSQYGEIVNINLIRDKDTGKSKGFCFLCYEDQRSTILAVDNLNAIKLLNRSIRVDHVSSYKIPKQGKKTDVETKKLYDEGCAPKLVPIEAPPPPPPQLRIKMDPNDFRATLIDQIDSEIKLPARLPIQIVKKEKLSDDEGTVVPGKEKEKKHKKEKKKKKKRKKAKKSSSDDSSSDEEPRKKKKRKHRDSSNSD